MVEAKFPYLDYLVVNEGAANEEQEADNLRPDEGLPSDGERNNPNEDSTGGVDSRAGGGGNGASDGEPKEVEEGDGENTSNTRAPNTGVLGEILKSSLNIQDRGLLTSGEVEDRGQDGDGDEAEQTLVTNSLERGSVILVENLKRMHKSQHRVKRG
jgi:hypothetical protein